ALPPQYGATSIRSCMPAFSTAHERCSAGAPASDRCALPMYVSWPPCAAAICAEAVWKNASSASPVSGSGTNETVAPPVPDFLIATSATGLLESASNPSGTSPASASRGLTNRPPSTRVAPTDGGGRTFAKGGIANGLTRWRTSCRETAASRSMFPRATATSSVELAIFDCAPIDHPSGFGPLAAWSCQQGWTSFITLETFAATPPLQAVVQRSERTPLGPSTTVYASPAQ